MANTQSAKRRVRLAEKRTAVNHARISRIRTYVKKLESALDGRKSDEAVALFPEIQSEVMRGVSKGVLKKNTASRKIARLAKRVKELNTVQIQ